MLIGILRACIVVPKNRYSFTELYILDITVQVEVFRSAPFFCFKNTEIVVREYQWTVEDAGPYKKFKKIL